MKQTVNEKTIQEEADTGSSSIDVSADVSIEGGSSLMDSIEETASDFNVTGFECANCGISHNHDTTKHKASDSFELGAGDSAKSLDSNGVCHCGYNEVAHRADDLGVSGAPSPSEAFRTAPIPDGERRRMQSDY